MKGAFKAEDFGKVLGDMVARIEGERRVDLYRDLLPTVYEELHESFQKPLGKGGGPAPPHAPSTVAKYGQHQLLVLSGALMRSATRSTGEGSDYSYSENGLSVGVDIPYAKYHQYGTKHIPQRKFFYLSDDGRGRIAEKVKELCFELLVGN